MRKELDRKNRKIMIRRYPGKILLFGEYAVLFGASGLLVPNWSYWSSWKSNPENDRQIMAQEFLINFSEHLLGRRNRFSNVLDLPYLKEDLEEGTYLDSTIPIGYGLGSSGSLCAAVLDRYALQRPSDLNECRSILASMEEFFHGSSSGNDPMVSYYQKAFRVNDQQLEMIEDLPKSGWKLHLLDSKKHRSTAPLVKRFHMLRLKGRCRRDLLPANEAAIDACLVGNDTSFQEAIAAISRFQWEHFQFAIPSDDSYSQELRELWQKGLKSEEFFLKLCGAGGGGFYQLWAPADFSVEDLSFSGTILSI